jgi:hypothetical protein
MILGSLESIEQNLQCQQILLKLFKMKICEKQFSDSWASTRQTDGQRDMVRLMDAFLNYSVWMHKK